MKFPVETTCYLQVLPKKYRQATVARVTNKKPTEPLPGAVVVKIKLLMPQAVFEPLEPSATVEIPEELIQRTIEVVATD